MKYRITPLNIIAAIFLLLAVYLKIHDFIVYEIIKKPETIGLGGLAPYLFVGITIGLLFLDLIIQLIFENRKKWIYIFQSILISFALFFFLKTILQDFF